MKCGTAIQAVAAAAAACNTLLAQPAFDIRTQSISTGPFADASEEASVSSGTATLTMQSVVVDLPKLAGVARLMDQSGDRCEQLLHLVIYPVEELRTEDSSCRYVLYESLSDEVLFRVDIDHAESALSVVCTYDATTKRKEVIIKENASWFKIDERHSVFAVRVTSDSIELRYDDREQEAQEANDLATFEEKAPRLASRLITDFPKLDVVGGNGSHVVDLEDYPLEAEARAYAADGAFPVP